MGGAVVDRLPDLARVQALGPIDAILVTHAHADHIGALPIIHLAYPQAPVYTSEATLALMRIMLADSLRIMQMKWMQEAEIPLYPEHAVESLLARAQAVRPDQCVDLCDGEMQMTFLLSGHVLGACSLTLDTREGRVLFTGELFGGCAAHGRLLRGAQTWPASPAPRSWRRFRSESLKRSACAWGWRHFDLKKGPPGPIVPFESLSATTEDRQAKVGACKKTSKKRRKNGIDGNRAFFSCFG